MNNNQPKVKAQYILPDDELVAVNMFLLPTPYKRYTDTYKKLGFDRDPLLTFLVINTKIYNLLSAPLAKFPTRDKHYLAGRIKDIILDLGENMIESASVESLSIPKAKEVSSGIKKLQYSLSLACSLKYISTNFHTKLQHHIQDLLNLLSMWFRVITKS